MKRLISNILCYLISFQLLVSCNSNQLAIDSVDTNFSISGLIVKSFENVGNAIFPSAMAAKTKTGVVSVYTVNDRNVMVKIGSYDIFNNEKKFNLKVPKSKVNESVLFFNYSKVGEDDRRDKIEIVDAQAKHVYTELNAQSTFASDIIREDIKEAVIGKPALGVEEIKVIVKNYVKADYNAAVQAVGGYTAYVSSFPTTPSSQNIVKLIRENKSETNQAVLKDEFRSEILAAQYAKVNGGKLDCFKGDKSTVVNSSGTSFDGLLYFSTKDENTVKAIGGDSVNLGKFKDEKTGNSLIESFLKSLLEMATKMVSTLKGAFGLLDRTNSVLTTCNATVVPPGVSVSPSGKAPASGGAPGSGSAPAAKAPAKQAKKMI